MSVKSYETTDEKGKKVKKWKVDFYVKGHRERKGKFDTKKEALEYEREFEKKYNRSEEMKVKSLVEMFLEYSKAREPSSTFMARKSCITTWFLPFFGEKPVSSIDALDLSNWQNKLLNSSLKSSSAKVVNSCMRALFDYGVTFLNFTKNPMPKLRVEVIQEEKKTITLEQLRILVENEKKEIYRHAMIILFWTGIRKGELLALKFDDFDLKNKTLRINKSFNAQTKITSTPKTKNSIRTIRINDDVVASVERLLEILYDSDIPIFISIANSVFLDHIKALGKRCGIDYLTIHTFRHSHATFLYAKKVDILVVSKRLGHSGISTTYDVYTHLGPSMVDELEEALEGEEGLCPPFDQNKKNHTK